MRWRFVRYLKKSFSKYFLTFHFHYKMKGDQALWHGIQRNIRSRQNSSGKGKSYLFRFAVDSPTQNHYRNSHLGHGVRGVCHADEVSYIFKRIRADVLDKDSMEFTAINRFVSFKTWNL